MECIDSLSLQGSTHGRINKDTVSAGGTATIHSVLKDLNWLERRERLILGPLKATELMRQLHDDCVVIEEERGVEEIDIYYFCSF